MPSKRKITPQDATRSELAKLRVTVRQLAATVADHAPQIERNRHDHEVAFARIAQLQAELDAVKQALQQVTKSPKKQQAQRES